MMSLKFVTVFLGLMWVFSSSAFCDPVLMIGISGGSGAGKTTFAKELRDRIGSSSKVGVISQDNYFLPLSQATEFVNGQPNGDHPSSMDFERMKFDLRALKEGRDVEIPKYDEKTDKVVSGGKIGPVDVLIFEGIHVFYDPEIREMMSYKVFLDIDSNLRFERRLHRDREDRKVLRTLFDQIVDPMYETYIYPTIGYADEIVRNSAESESILGRLKEIISNHLELRENKIENLNELIFSDVEFNENKPEK